MYRKEKVYRKKKERKGKKKLAKREGCETRMIQSIVGSAYRKKLLNASMRK